MDPNRDFHGRVVESPGPRELMSTEGHKQISGWGHAGGGGQEKEKGLRLALRRPGWRGRPSAATNTGTRWRLRSKLPKSWPLSGRAGEDLSGEAVVQVPLPAVPSVPAFPSLRDLFACT